MVRFSIFTGLACCLLTAGAASGQTPPPAGEAARTGKAAAYYYYSVGHLYAELAGQYNNRGDLFAKAVESYKQAMKADPSAGFISEELSELYIQSGRLREAVTEAEDLLKQSPDDLNARRILARIYTRMIGDSQQNRIDEAMVKKAIEQYQKITEKDPKDTESWLMLGRLENVSHNSPEAQTAFKKALEIDPNNEDAMTGLAMVYSNLGDTKSATELLRKAAELHPSANSLKTLAAAYEDMKEYQLAAETLKKALSEAAGDPELEKALAKDLLLSNQFDEALGIYQGLVSEDPKDVESQLRISQVYRQKRDFANARKAGDKAKEMDPSNIEVQFNDVNLYEAEGKTPQAISALKDILNTTSKKSYNPAERANRVQLLEHLGFLYRTNEQWAQAVETFRQIGEIDPESGSKAAAQVIDTYRAGREFPKAEQEAEAAARKYPNDRVVRSARAAMLADMGKTDQAIAETKKLLGGKDDRDTYLSLAQIYDKAKNYTEMAKSLDQAEKLSSSKEDKETVYFMRGAMFERMKKYDEAEAEFKKVLDANPENASALNYLGYMLADRNVRLEEAHRLIAKAVDQEPNNGAYLDSLGWVYYRQNKLPDAEKVLLRALETMGKDATVHDHLGDVYFQEGKTREAIAQWQTSLKSWQSGSPSEMDAEEVAKVQKKLDSAKVRQARESKQP